MNIDKNYPLKQILEVKKKREDEAEKVFKQKQLVVEKEEKKLEEIKKVRDQFEKHYQEKLAQLRQVLDEGSTSTTIKQMKDYLKVAKEKVVKEDVKVKEQQKVLDNAIKEMENAKTILKEKRKEVEKLEIHHEAWQKETRKTAQIKEEQELDEIGTTIYYGKKGAKDL